MSAVTDSGQSAVSNMRAELHDALIEVQRNASETYHKAQAVLEAEMPKFDALATSVASDPVITAAMETMLPAGVGEIVGGFIRALGQHPAIRAAAVAQATSSPSAAPAPADDELQDQAPAPAPEPDNTAPDPGVGT